MLSQEQNPFPYRESNIERMLQNEATPDFATYMTNNYTAFFVLRIALTVVPQTVHWPFSAGLPFFIVTC